MRAPASAATWRARAGLHSLTLLPALPLVPLALLARLRRRRALVGLGAKLSGAGPPLPQGAVLLHGVSLGEVALLRPLVPALAAHAPQLLLTTSTETGWEGLQRQFPDRPRAFLPFDLPWAVERFLARTRPRLVVLLENEVWPLLLCACARRGIPVVLAHGRLSERSFRRWRHVAAIARPLFASLALVIAQNATYAARYVHVGVPRARVVVAGSMKADAIRPATPAATAALRERLGLDPARPVLLLASTSDPEERRLLPLVLPWAREQWQIVCCPRHPERGAACAQLAQQFGLLPWRASVDETPASGPGVRCWIIDAIGHLGALYALVAASTGISIVGGSCGSGRGGQNMLESAAAGACTVVGWDTRNQADGMQLLRDHQGVVELPAADPGAPLAALARDPARRAALGAAAARAWHRGQGAGARVARALTQLLARGRPPHPAPRA